MNAAQCVEDWKLRNGEPSRPIGDDGPGALEQCAWCGKLTRSGIYVRANVDDLMVPPIEGATYTVQFVDGDDDEQTLVDTDRLDGAMLVYEAIYQMVTLPGNKHEAEAVGIALCYGDRILYAYARGA